MASVSMTVRISLDAVREEILRQTLEEVYGRGKYGELSGQECAEVSRKGLEVWREMGGQDGA